MDDTLREQFISLMTRCRKMNATFSANCELQMNELALLHIISGKCTCCEQGGINLNMQSIQERLQISKPAVSYTLNALEKKSYIVREIDPKDRRRISIQITPEGIAASEDSMRRYAHLWNRLLEDFGEANMVRLTQLLTRLFAVMDDICDHGPDV